MNLLRLYNHFSYNSQPIRLYMIKLLISLDHCRAFGRIYQLPQFDLRCNITTKLTCNIILKPRITRQNNKYLSYMSEAEYAEIVKEVDAILSPPSQQPLSLPYYEEYDLLPLPHPQDSSSSQTRFVELPMSTYEDLINQVRRTDPSKALGAAIKLRYLNSQIISSKVQEARIISEAKKQELPVDKGQSRRVHKRLTPQQREQACGDYEEGMKITKIADKFNVSRATILNVLKDNGIK